MGAGGTGSGGADPGGTGAGSDIARPFAVGGGAPGGPIEVDLDASFTALDGFEWAIPAAALSVPLVLVLLAVGGQALVGLAWVPLTRRWLGGDRRRRPRVSVGSAPRNRSRRHGSVFP